MIDPTGKTVIRLGELGFETGIDAEFSEGLLYVVKSDPKTGDTLGHGFMDREGKVKFWVKDCGGAGPFQNGFSAVSIKGELVYIDRTGKIAVRPPPGGHFLHNLPGEG